MQRVAIGIVAALLLAAPGVSADPKSAIAQGIATEAHNHSRSMVPAAEAMPAEKYGFKPGPTQASFADLIVHSADANYTLCSAAVGDTKPDMPVKPGSASAAGGAAGTKDTLVDQLKKSFAYCDAAFERIDAAKLDTEIQLFGRTVTRAWVLFHMALDWGDHYAQAAAMLRLNGITPPSAQPRR
jgi:uncharacterized damage-inducible protein DinB